MAPLTIRDLVSEVARLQRRRRPLFARVATIGVGLAFYAPDAVVASSIQLAQQTSQVASTLPGGASSLNETYRDWQVACSQQNNAKRCALSQSQAQQNGQRVLTIELNAPTGNTVAGIVVLPFGLALDKGVTLQIDDKPAGPPLRFRTCLPVGCVVPVSFDASALTTLRVGGARKVKATTDGGRDAPFSIPLQGFATALDRVAILAR